MADDKKWLFTVMVLGVILGWFFNHFFVIQRRYGISDLQMNHVFTRIDEARNLELHEVKLHFGLYRVVRENLESNQYNVTYHPRDDECIQSLSSIREGSAEYWQKLYQNECHLMYTPHTKISWE